MSGWRTARLEEVAEVCGGSTPSRQVASYFGGEIAWATPTDVTALDGMYIHATKERITEAGLQNSSTRLLPAGAVLLTSRATIGYTAVAQIPICTNQGFVNFVCSSDLLPEYLAYWLRTQREKMLQHAGGTTFKEIARGTLRKFLISFPGLGEQRRIIDLLSRAEGIVRLRREAQKKAYEIIPALFLDMFGDPATNPKRWPMQAIQQLCSVQTGATPRKEQARYYEAGTVPWVKTGEVCESHILKAEEQITDLAIRETNCKVFPVNTILIAMYGQGQTRGRAGMLKIPAATNQACAAILPGDKVDQAFLFEMLKVQYERLRAMGRGGNQANLNLGMIKALEVPCPPMDVQARFVAHVTALESIRTQHEVASKRSLSIFEALLSKLFSAGKGRSNVESLEVAVA